ncbi:TPA: ead/Ea22-like family protein [Escherichia coli]|nr:ead/Ea22-like family protein [Escherichia coli]MDM8849154.1 ead/Ea22-like family protein [Escherichia coli]HBE5860248.1 ead/Ea22-like family protein [Escherichia coli]HBV0130535.1 ead/Ea22-like family protein [Escherichia coli]
MSEINYQALRELAKQATQGEWVAFISPGKYGTYAVHTPGDNHHGDIVDWPGFDGQKNAENNARYIAAFNPEVVQALLDEREAQSKRIAELEEKAAPDSFGIIGENIRTQDNRITSDPMFCVYQKREIVVDADYDYDRIVWVDEDGNEANKRQSRRLELLHENFREPPEKWRRVAVKDIDEFVTCCFTEQGCKDYLAVNGHNLRLPFIYVKSGFRNAEYIGIRNWLAGIRIKGE